VRINSSKRKRDDKDTNNPNDSKKGTDDVVVIDVDDNVDSSLDTTNGTTSGTTMTTTNNDNAKKKTPGIKTVKPKCTFFQWDDNHQQDTNQLSLKSSWVHKLLWFRYETEHGYCLTHPKGHYAPHHVKQGAMGNCWFLSALVS
jgi:hypothetical protein